MAELTPEVQAFLSEGTRTGKLGYLGADGRPLVVPIWFVVEHGVVLFNTGRTSAKGRAILRDPRVTLCVDSEVPPYGFVQVQAEAAVSEDPSDLLRTATLIGGRYMGADRADEFGRRNGVSGELLVRLTPQKVIARFAVAD